MASRDKSGGRLQQPACAREDKTRKGERETERRRGGRRFKFVEQQGGVEDRQPQNYRPARWATNKESERD